MRVPNFCFGWLDLISHKQFMTGCPSHSKSSLLITRTIIFPTLNLHFLLYNQRAPGFPHRLNWTNSDLHRSSQYFLSIPFQVFSPDKVCPLHCYYPLPSSAQGHASSRSLGVADGCCQDHPVWKTRSVQCVQALIVSPEWSVTRLSQVPAHFCPGSYRTVWEHAIDTGTLRNQNTV